MLYIQHPATVVRVPVSRDNQNTAKESANKVENSVILMRIVR